MGKILDALKGSALPINKQRAVAKLDAEFSELQSQLQILKTENLQLQAEVNPLKRELAAHKEKIELLLAPKHPDASSPEHISTKPRPRVIMGRPGHRR